VTAERRQTILMLLPYGIGAVVLFIVPALLTFVLAFTDASLVQAPNYVGGDNFVNLSKDVVFDDVLRHTLAFVALVVPIRILVATGAALLLHARFRGAAAGRTAVFLPTVIPDAAAALLWIFVFNPIYGPANALLGALGVGPVSWFSDSTAAFAMIAIALAFTVGESFVVALAARQELPEDLYAIARLEGAGPWHVLRTVTLPLMAPVLALLAIRDVAVVLQLSFSFTYLLTDGGPDRATLFLPIYSFDVGFEGLRYGYATAMTLLLFVGCLALAFLQWRIVRRWRLALGG
jgi:multiple sugar transport system permease protein